MSTATDQIKCQWCGQTHGVRCPEVKAFEFFDNGVIKRVEYVTRGDMHPHHIDYVQPLPRQREITQVERERIVREERRKAGS